MLPPVGKALRIKANAGRAPAADPRAQALSPPAEEGPASQPGCGRRHEGTGGGEAAAEVREMLGEGVSLQNPPELLGVLGAGTEGSCVQGQARGPGLKRPLSAERRRALPKGRPAQHPRQHRRGAQGSAAPGNRVRAPGVEF